MSIDLEARRVPMASAILVSNEGPSKRVDDAGAMPDRIEAWTAPVHEIRAAVADGAESREHRDLVLDAASEFQLGHDFVARARRRRHPACAARRRIGQTESPEISAEPHRQRRAVGEGGAVAVEEHVEHRQPT